MASNRIARPIFTIAAMAVLAAGIAACQSGGSGAQSGYDPAYSGYSNGASGYAGSGSGYSVNPNEANSLNWQNQAEQNGYAATSDMGPGGAADPADDGNSVSYSGGDDGSDG